MQKNSEYLEKCRKIWNRKQVCFYCCFSKLFTKNAEKFQKFRIDNSSVLIVSAFYPIKVTEQCRKIQKI
jgi:hypothetical protein